MTHSAPTDDWDTIQDVFYRREQVYRMSWQADLDLSDHVVAIARCGGPIAMLRDERKIVPLGRYAAAGKPRIQVYTAAGVPIASFIWDLPPPIHLSFTPDESLLVISESGLYRLYALSSSASSTSRNEYAQYTLGPEVVELGVMSAHAYEDGFVVLTGGLGLVEVRGWEGGRGVAMAQMNLTEPPHAWTIIPPDRSSSGHLQVLLATSSTILTIDASDLIDQRLANGPFTSVRVSPSGKFVALLNTSSVLWVVSSDFSRSLSEVDVGALLGGSRGGGGEGSRPDSIEWCGDDSVAIAWQSTGRVLLIGPTGEFLSYLYEGRVLLGSEVDGLSLISVGSMDFVQKVPDATLAVFKPGSTHPAAILLEAMDHFERKSPKADENIRNMRADLPDAVDACIEAAGNERGTFWQKRLLRAAMFGRAFLDLYNPTDLVQMARTLKVLNAVRDFQVGIPLTHAQYSSSSPESLITRLVSRNLHLLALRISAHLQLRPEPVLEHWACAKVAAATAAGEGGAEQDRELLQAIVTKFEREGGKGVHYANIARRAWQLGRSRLATKLLDNERQASQQVPLLLAMKEDRAALIKAIQSSDTDLVYHVLLHLRQKLAPGDLFSLIDDKSAVMLPALKLLQAYGHEADRDLLRNYYYQDDRRLDSACLDMEEGNATDVASERLAKLQSAAKYLSEDKERGFETKMAEEAHRLLAAQIAMEKELDYKYQLIGLSVNDMLRHLLLIGLGKRAERIRSDFKVPDKRWWYIKMKALVENKDWEQLDAFARSKSAIGYEPFVVACLDVGQPHRAAVFVSRCQGKNRIDLYVRCGEYGKAALECKEQKETGRLEQLRQSAPNNIALRDVEEVIRKMGR